MNNARSTWRTSEDRATTIEEGERLSLLESKIEEIDRSHQQKFEEVQLFNQEKIDNLENSLKATYERKIIELENKLLLLTTTARQQQQPQIRKKIQQAQQQKRHFDCGGDSGTTDSSSRSVFIEEEASVFYDCEGPSSRQLSISEDVFEVVENKNDNDFSTSQYEEDVSDIGMDNSLGLRGMMHPQHSNLEHCVINPEKYGEKYASTRSLVINPKRYSSTRNRDFFSNEPTPNLSELDPSKDDLLIGEHYFLPPDIYSYLACAQYFGKKEYNFLFGIRIPLIFPKKTFIVAIVVCAVQVLTLGIFLSDVIDMNDKLNPIQVPADVSVEVSISQLIALLISCFCQDEIRCSFNVLGLGYHSDKVCEIHYSASIYKWYFSAYIRIALGFLNLIVTFILILNSNTVRDVMLDFAAVTFVSELDNGAFTVAQWGYFGPSVKSFTLKIQDTPVFDKVYKSDPARRRPKIPRLVSLLGIFTIVFGFWGFLKVKQIFGAYVDDTIFVQFGDDFSPALGTFSGLYDIDIAKSFGEIRAYASREIGPYPSGLSKFSYCKFDRTWVFQYGNSNERQNTILNQDDRKVNSDASNAKRCWSNARSSKTLSFDLVESSSELWYVYDQESKLDMPLRTMYISGEDSYYGKECDNDDDGTKACGDRLYCNNNGICVCKDNKFGLLCEFPQPCTRLEIDERDINGFTGTRTWSRSYSSIRHGEEDNGETNTPILSYGKPIYIGDDEAHTGVFDVMVFTGRRWILTESSWIQINYKNNTNKKMSKQQFAKILSDNFHAYWSNYTFFFTSEAVDVGTPTDSATPQGLQWYRLETASDDKSKLGFDFKSKDAKKNWKTKTAVAASLICAVCDNGHNPCYYGSDCNADNGICECSTGSRGTLCQIPPDGNGLCDIYFNTPEFNYDGGDCCKETCVSTEEHICGDGIIQNDNGLEAQGRVGFLNCEDPRFKSRISGSVTLHEIVERGTVRCGFVLAAGYFEYHDGVYSGFEAEFCKSIGAAALGDPEAVEYIALKPKDRFIALENGEIDVMFWTTYTAERDIHESTSKVGFSFSSPPHFYDGVKFGGIPPFLNCADNKDFESAECVGMKICALQGSSWLQKTKEIFPDKFIMTVASIDNQYEALDTGLCNVHVGESNVVAEVVVRNAGFSGSAYEVGRNTFSKEPLSPATRKDDRVWSKFVSWTIQTLIQAEAARITQANANRLGPNDVFGEQFQDMFRNAVAATGNYGEIYEKTLEEIIPRSALNVINRGHSGLIYSFPLGNYESRGPDPIKGGTIETIRKRGVLNCGVIRKYGFASRDPVTMDWKGIDIDICKGIAAAILNGFANINVIDLNHSQRFEALAAGTVDVLCAATTHTLSREVKEVGTGEGYDFSPHYFYDGLGFGGVPMYARCADDLIFDRTTLRPDCIDTKICVPGGTTWLDSLRGTLNVPSANLVVTASMLDSYDKFNDSFCNVIAAETADLLLDAVRQVGYTGEYYVGLNKHTREPFAAASRSDDIQFSDFVRWVIFGFFFAAEQDITKSTYYNLPASFFLFGDSLSTMWQHAIEASGNHKEILLRHFGEDSSILEGFNAVNDGSGPIQYPVPGILFN